MQKGQMTIEEVEEWFKLHKLKLSELEKKLIISEGFVPQFYYDTKNILTFGVGHNCRDNFLKHSDLMIIIHGSLEDRVFLAIKFLREDTSKATYQLLGIIDTYVSKDRINSLVEMVFHMGIGSFKGFKK